MTGNDIVKLLLKTPMRIFLGNTMLITVTGCKTGRKYSTPVGFYREGDDLWILTSRDRIWWRNLRNGADVCLLLEGKNIDAFARAELGGEAVERHMLEYLHHIPMAARSLGIRMENTAPNRADLQRVVKDRLFVQVHLNG